MLIAHSLLTEIQCLYKAWSEAKDFLLKLNILENVWLLMATI